MNLKKLNEAMEMVKEQIPKGLTCSSIVSLEDGQALAGYNNDPVTDALLTQTTIYAQQSVATTAFKKLNSFYMMQLASQKTCLCIVGRNCWWGIVVDPKQISLGMLFNVLVPKAVSMLEEAVS